MYFSEQLSPNAQAHPADVVAAKLILRDLGHYEVPEWGVSEYPDRNLFEAIKSFQSQQGLKQDGVIKADGETVKVMAQYLQSLGRNGDTILAHITPAEAELLHRVTDGGSINPITGIAEFYDTMSDGGIDSYSDSGNGPSSDDTSDNSSSSDDGMLTDWSDNSNYFGEDTTSTDDNPTRTEYEKNLHNKKGLDKFAYGMRHGWKNWNSSKYNEPGVYDRDLGRMLTHADFKEGGILDPNTPRGKLAIEKAKQQRAEYAALLEEQEKAGKAKQSVNTVSSVPGKPTSIGKSIGQLANVMVNQKITNPLSLASAKPNLSLAGQLGVLSQLEKSKNEKTKAEQPAYSPVIGIDEMLAGLKSNMPSLQQSMPISQARNYTPALDTRNYTPVPDGFFEKEEEKSFSHSNKASASVSQPELSVEEIWAALVGELGPDPTKLGSVVGEATQVADGTKGNSYRTVEQGGAVSMDAEDPYMSPIGPILESIVNFADGIVDRATNPDRNTYDDPRNNTMTDEEIKTMKDEISSIAKDELIGGTLKITGARTGGVIGGALDSIGDQFLERAQKNKEDWGYNK